MAGRENFNILAFLHLTEIRCRIFIEEDGAGHTPDLLRAEERHQENNQP
jgi:hypothetical protein